MNRSVVKLKCCECDKIFGYATLKSEVENATVINSIIHKTNWDYFCLKLACCEECAKDLLNDGDLDLVE